MEFTNLLSNHGFRLWVTQFLIVFFLAGGLALLLIGLNLIFNSAETLRLVERLNRWVSLRQALKPLEIPRDTRAKALMWRRWIAVVFIAGGGFALLGLATRYDAGAIIYGLGLGFLRPAFAYWMIDSARWVLIVGNLVGIALGIMLAFFPGAVEAVEARGSRWYSERRHAVSRDAMRVTMIDDWVAAFPRASGLVITLFAIFLIGAFGLMLPAIR